LLFGSNITGIVAGYDMCKVGQPVFRYRQPHVLRLPNVSYSGFSKDGVNAFGFQVQLVNFFKWPSLTYWYAGNLSGG
jgi:hypothetical protein